MKRRILCLTAALALTALCGCGAASGDNGASGKGIFYTRAATDQEAFSQVLELQDAEEIDLEDGEVPLSGQPAAEDAQEQGWLLVRYAKNEDGVVEPQWYRVWTEDGGWSQESLPYEGTGWTPVLSAPAEVEVRPLG